MVQIERMSTNSLSDVKMVQNWRVPPEQNWRSPGPRMPKYFIPRNNNLKSTNYDSPMTLLNKMISFPRWNFNLCNTKDFKKITSGRFDFYPDFEGITKIVQDTFVNAQNINNFDKTVKYNTNANIISFLTQNKLSNSPTEEPKELLEETVEVESNKDMLSSDRSKAVQDFSEIEKEKESSVQNSSKCLSEKMVMKDEAMQSQEKRVCPPDKPINKNKKKSKHSSKKCKKIKTGKHKRKSDTLNNIMEDYYLNFEELDDQKETEEDSVVQDSNKLVQNFDSFTNTSCSNKLSQSLEKCWNYLQSLSSIKHINNVMSVSKNSPENTKKNDFVYVHNLDDGHLATECIDIKNDQMNKRTRMPSECETEDSFVIFVDENQDDENEGGCGLMRKPSLCDSNDSFVICFGDSCQSPEECFTFEDIIDRSPCDSGSSSYEDDSDSDNESEISDTDSTYSSRNSLTCSSVVKQNKCRDSTAGGFLNKTKKKLQKKVSFDTEKPVIHHMIAWSYAYHQARKGDWEQYGRDRVRFEQRIEKTKTILNPILIAQHRKQIYDERFKNFDPPVSEENNKQSTDMRLPDCSKENMAQSKIRQEASTDIFITTKSTNKRS